MTYNLTLWLQREDLRRHYGLEFVTSSLEKKAAAAAIRDKIEQDSVRVGVAEIEEGETSSSNACSSSAAYEIAATAASFVQSQTEHLIALGSEPRLSEEGEKLLEEADEGHASVSLRKHKSERAACAAADAMTALVAAGEKEKEKAARDLQSLHSAPCEWFVCDDSDIYTRCFVIQVNLTFISSNIKKFSSMRSLSLHETCCVICRDRTR